MDTLTLLAGLTGGLAALCLLTQATAAANRYVERTGGLPVAAAATEPAAGARAEDLPERQRTDPPPHRTAGHWWNQLLSPPGVLGALLAPLKVLFLPVAGYPDGPGPL